MWQALQAELEPFGVTVVTVALDLDPEKARPWIAAAAPTHPALVDSEHRIDELFGISNVPMAVWVDENGTVVRPAESATIRTSKIASMEITDAIPEPQRRVLTELQQLPGLGETYRAAIVDWAERGADSPFALSPQAVIAASLPRSADQSRASACFEMGRHFYENGDTETAVAWWKEAHALYPENWTYKRQAWTLESTAEGADSDMAQNVGDVYGTSWTKEFLHTGGANYGIQPNL